MKNILSKLAALAAVFCFAAAPAPAVPGVPGLLNYQGKVFAGGTPFQGTGKFKFALVSGDGATTFWSNDGTSVAGSEPTAAVDVAVAQGIYALQLGDTTLANMTTIPASAFTQNDVRLRIWFNDGTTGSQRLIPDQRVAAVGYALVASTVPDGAITSTKIAAGAVGSTQLAAGAVGATQLAAGAVGAAQIAAGSIDASKLAAGSVGATQLAAGGVGFAQLAKPPQAGIFNVDPLAGLLQTVSFPQAYAAAPVVTITASSSPTTTNASASLISSTATDFTAQVRAQLVGRPVGSPAIKGFDSAMQVIGGKLAIAYVAESGDLEYVRATDAAATTWSTPATVVANVNNTGFGGFAIQLVNGRPAIVYTESDFSVNPLSSSLKYVRAGDADGATWGSPLPLATATSQSSRIYSSSFAVVNGRPAVAYSESIQDFTNGDSRKFVFVRANDADGTAFGTPVPLASSATDSGSYLPSLQIVNGRPAIAYSDPADFNVKYVRGTDADGTAFGTAVIVDAGYLPSLLIVNGRPALGYLDGNDSFVTFVRASDADGTAWGTPVSSKQVADSFTIQVVNGRPSFAYTVFDAFSGFFVGVKYLRATDTDGTAFAPPLTLLGTEQGDLSISSTLQDLNGQPALVYTENLGNFLKLVMGGGSFPLNWIALPQ